MNLTSLIGKICNKDVKKIGLFGLGRSNTDLAQILLSEGFSGKFICRQTTHGAPDASVLGITDTRFGDEALSDFCEDAVFLSPSVRRTDALIRAASDAGSILCSDAELFFAAEPKNVFAITGSDGKSTVTYLTSRLMSGVFDAPPAGNYGLPLCRLISADKLCGCVVELSSFQLNYIKPRVSKAIITSISENHLNWHEDFEEYVRAKTNLLQNAQCRIIVADGEECHNIARSMHTDVIVSDKHTAKELQSLYHPEITFTRENGYICVNGKPYVPTDIAKRSEDYNVRNLMCALALSYEYTDKDSFCELARSFGGLAHRNEHFLTRGGVSYINSSIDSTPKRTATTLATLSSPAIVIIGGATKGLSYDVLTDALCKYAKYVILTGESTASMLRILEECSDLRGKIFTAKKFEDAAKLSVRLSKSGDTVILSPAHTSFDRFENFEQRGDYFKRIIEEYTK